MPLPKCFDILNLDYFNNLSNQIGAVGTAAELQALVNAVFADISLLESTITSQIASLTNMSSLITAPAANPAAIVTWITSFITDFLTPLIVPLTTMTAQLVAIAAQVALLTTAIEEAEARLGASITIPPIVIGCSL